MNPKYKNSNDKKSGSIMHMKKQDIIVKGLLLVVKRKEKKNE